jgi:hypothetical protein
MFLQWNAPVPEIEHSVRALLAKQFVATITAASHIGRIASGFDKYDALTMPTGIRVFFDPPIRISNDRIPAGLSH